MRSIFFSSVLQRLVRFVYSSSHGISFMTTFVISATTWKHRMEKVTNTVLIDPLQLARQRTKLKSPHAAGISRFGSRHNPIVSIGTHVPMRIGIDRLSHQAVPGATPYALGVSGELKTIHDRL